MLATPKPVSVPASMGVAVLGATGTIGVNTLDVIARHPGRYHVVALSANTDDERLYQQCLIHRPTYAALMQEAAAERLTQRLRAQGLDTDVLHGVAGLEQLAALPEVDCVMAAIVGAAGLAPTLAAVRGGKRVLLANKEALVMAGALFMDEVRRHKALLLPIDSEHNAVFQCVPADFRRGLEQVGVRRILLTASGGPFRETPLSELSRVTPEQACAHPNWVMGRKISVDSATMMNKGLELIEACWLFDTTPDHIQIVLHPQSVIHSMVEYVDGSVLAQLGNPDMRTPIAHALAWPERIASGVERLDIFSVARLDFSPPDETRFPCLPLAYQAWRAGGTAPTLLNAANECAVQAFLERRIPFTAIARVIEQVLSELAARPAVSLAVIDEDDRAARRCAQRIIQQTAQRATS
ncbi:MAG: 1-deoxy-D-xylulose-5-phosphate reductoisomerase [Gammaproteobacteria bacterium]